MKKGIKSIILIMLMTLGIMFIDSKADAYTLVCRYKTNDKSVGDITVEVDDNKNLKYYPMNGNFKGSVVMAGALRDKFLEDGLDNEHCPSVETKIETGTDGKPVVRLIATSISCRENQYVSEQFDKMLADIKADYDADIEKLKKDDYAYYKRYTDIDIAKKEGGELAHQLEQKRSRSVRAIKETAEKAGCQLTADMLQQIEALRINKQNELYNAINEGIKRMKTDGYFDDLIDKGEITEEDTEKLEDQAEAAIEEAKKKYEPVYEYGEGDYIEIENGDLSCESLLDVTLVEYINKILNYLRIIVPILVIVLGTVDFGKAVLNEEKDEFKQSFTKFVKRLIIAIVIFFIPTILNLLVTAYNTATDGIPLTPLSECGIK